jgi:hypothetical protein
VNKLGFKITTFANIQQPGCDWQFKSTRPARPGIKVENALPFVKIRPMRMAVEHCSKFARHWVQVERTQVVEHVHIAVANENDIGFRQLAAWALAVNVSADRRDWGNLFQFLENGGVADISQVQNALNAGQR